MCTHLILHTSTRTIVALLIAGSFALQNTYAAPEPTVDDREILSFSTVGDSRQDPVAPDPTTLPLSGQDAMWLENTKAWSRIMQSIEEQRSSLLFFNGDMIMGYGNAVVPANNTNVAGIVGSDLVKLVEEIAEREAPGSKVKARISGEAFLTPPGPLYDVVVAAIEEETGAKPELSTSGGTSDGRFLIKLCPVVDFGLPNATMHKVGECAAVEDIRALSRIYERIVRKALD